MLGRIIFHKLVATSREGMLPGSFQVTWLQRRDLKIVHFAHSPGTTKGRVASNSGDFIDDNQQLELHRLPLEGSAGHRRMVFQRSLKVAHSGPIAACRGFSRAPSLKHVSEIQM